MERVHGGRIVLWRERISGDVEGNGSQCWGETVDGGSWYIFMLSSDGRSYPSDAVQAVAVGTMVAVVDRVGWIEQLGKN